jgi:hypothetical protein
MCPVLTLYLMCPHTTINVVAREREREREICSSSERERERERREE